MPQIEIVNSYLGAPRTVGPSETKDLDSLKLHICNNDNISVENMFLLVAPSGHQLRDIAALEDASASAIPRVFVYDKQWAHTESSRPHGGDGNAMLCLEAADIAVRNLIHNLRAVSKLLDKHRHGQLELQDDVVACHNWRRYYSALEQIPELSTELPNLLKVSEIEQSYADLVPLWSHALAEIEKLGRVQGELQTRATNLTSRKHAESLHEAQKELVSVLRKVSQIQLRIMNDLRKPLNAVGEELKRVEELKLQVARVIDLPFLYGVLLIEHARRTKWKNDFGPILVRELERRREWHKHYGDGSIGSVVERLDEITGLHIMRSSEAEDLLGQGDKTEAARSEVMSYLQTLEALNLDEVHRELLTELGAMKRQLARSMSASISSLAPDLSSSVALSGKPSAAPSPSPQQAPQQPAIAAYESRIRKLETMLMARLSSKTHEIDLIRAETRAEARAEAKAEVRAEQQENRIAELEKQNAELSHRLQLYVSGLEAALNSMGLQTSRVDPETGTLGGYHVNRVKGLSRKGGAASGENSETGVASSPGVVSHSATPSGIAASGNHDTGHSPGGRAGHSAGISTGNGAGNGNTGAEAGGSASASESGSDSHSSRDLRGDSSSHTTDSPRTVSMERLLEQTYVDNQVLFEAVSKRFGDVERLARKLQIENRKLKDRDAKMERDLRQRVALHSFRAEDLILFLPTRDPRRQPNPWAAFNAGAPHYFLHPKHAEQLKSREYLIARASSIERHVSSSEAENPFQLPPGVEWFLISIHGEWGV